jgi:hypothetical protein
MNMQDFPIEVNFEDTTYFGAVHPIMEGREIKYSVSLETDDPATRFDLVLRPSDSKLTDWEFLGDNGQKVTDSYNDQFLREIGCQVTAAF